MWRAAHFVGVTCGSMPRALPLYRRAVLCSIDSDANLMAVGNPSRTEMGWPTVSKTDLTDALTCLAMCQICCAIGSHPQQCVEEAEKALHMALSRNPSHVPSLLAAASISYSVRRDDHRAKHLFERAVTSAKARLKTFDAAIKSLQGFSREAKESGGLSSILSTHSPYGVGCVANYSPDSMKKIRRAHCAMLAEASFKYGNFCERALGDTGLAIKMFVQAVEAYPGYVLATARLARIQCLKKAEMKVAESLWRAILNIDTNDILSFSHLVTVLRRLRTDHHRAERAYSSAAQSTTVVGGGTGSGAATPAMSARLVLYQRLSKFATLKARRAKSLGRHNSKRHFLHCYQQAVSEGDIHGQDVSGGGDTVGMGTDNAGLGTNSPMFVEGKNHSLRPSDIDMLGLTSLGDEWRTGSNFCSYLESLEFTSRFRHGRTGSLDANKTSASAVSQIIAGTDTSGDTTTDTAIETSFASASASAEGIDSSRLMLIK